MTRMSELNLTPIVKTKLKEKDPKLMKIIRKYSTGGLGPVLEDDLRQY